MNQLQVAVILPVYNAGSVLANTIESILAQDYDNFHLYIVDDGSTDNSLELLAAYDALPRISVIHQGNRGQAAAINAGIAAGREPFIALCDADDVWRRDRLRRSILALQEHPSASFVCSDFCRGDDLVLAWRSEWAAHGYSHCQMNCFATLLEENFVCRSSVTLRRELLEEVGRFSERIGGKCGADDRDVWLTLTWRFGPAHRINDVLVWKRSWNGNGSRNVHFAESSVRLWTTWTARLGNLPGHRRRAKRNLVRAIRELGWRYRKEGRYWKSIKQSLTLLAYPSFSLIVPLDIARTGGHALRLGRKRRSCVPSITRRLQR